MRERYIIVVEMVGAAAILAGLAQGLGLLHTGSILFAGALGVAAQIVKAR